MPVPGLPGRARARGRVQRRSPGLHQLRRGRHRQGLPRHLRPDVRLHLHARRAQAYQAGRQRAHPRLQTGLRVLSVRQGRHAVPRQPSAQPGLPRQLRPLGGDLPEPGRLGLLDPLHQALSSAVPQRAPSPGGHAILPRPPRQNAVRRVRGPRRHQLLSLQSLVRAEDDAGPRPVLRPTGGAFLQGFLRACRRADAQIHQLPPGPRKGR